MKRKLLAALAPLPLLLGAGPAAADPEVRYVALGDSYSAGVAAGDYDPASGDCRRSANAYPALWSSAHHPVAFRSLACLGADTAQVERDQLPQVPADTTLVTLTVGGNDLGFTEAAEACLQPLTTDARCDKAMTESDRRLREELPGHLAQLFQDIHQAAPAARVVVAGYPHLLETGGPCLVGPDSRRSRFNAVTDQLDGLIQSQAKEQGAEFVDVRTAFAGHGACTQQGASWITGLSLPLWESFHPTRDGQALAYLPMVGAAVPA